MGFSLGGFSSTSGQCGCCAPPCHWQLCVSLVPPCGWLSYSGTELRLQGPDGSDIDVTETLTGGSLSFCYADPPAGVWTITVSRTCYKTQVFPVTVEQCKSQTISVTMQSLFTTLHYSDDFGSLDFPLTGPDGGCLCIFHGHYIYNSDHVIRRVDCGYGHFICLLDQSFTVQATIDIYLIAGADGFYINWQRRIPTAQGRESCDPSSATGYGAIGTDGDGELHLRRHVRSLCRCLELPDLCIAYGDLAL